MTRVTPSSEQPLALITGVGPGVGTSLARRFADGGYRVAMLARDAQRLAKLEAEIPGTLAKPCDVTDVQALKQVIEELDTPRMIVHNAVGGSFAPFQETDPAVLQKSFQTNTLALLHLAQMIAPAMIDAGEGSIMVTSNTSALRGKPNFAGFAPTKAAQRILAESLARDLGLKGIHVAYLVIDAVIDAPWAREKFSDAPDDFFIQPRSIATEIFHLAHQPRDAWTFLSEVRPYHEPW